MSKFDHDLIIVGGGPSGLSAAINASSEGLNTLLIDSKDQLGGQASESAAIENYPGFPKAITGKDLMSRFITHARKFRTQFLRPVVVTGIRTEEDGTKTITTNDDQLASLSARTVLLALGLSYKRLQAKGIGDFLGMGVSYGAPVVDSDKEGQCFCVVGGANSAGQAAVHLSKINGCKVKMLIRGKGLETGMSQYLIEQITAVPNIEIMPETEVIEACGDSRLRSIMIKQAGEISSISADGLYIFIGASPKTFWLNGVVEKSDRGYILTGRRVKNWPAKREILPFETSVPGIFAAGDVRDNLTKRVSAAIGEGSVAVQQIHTYLSGLLDN